MASEFDLTPGEKARATQYIKSIPGPGNGVPKQDWENISNIANGITEPLYGRQAHPSQVKWLYDNGHHTPQQIHEVFSQQPHPHAPDVNIGEYQDYAHAYKVWKPK